jgi:DNA invertase Pin-like site-specific DNA recombinase
MGILGYARVSTGDQDLSGQRRRLEAAGAVRIFEDVISGREFERPGLAALLDYAREGDSLCVVRLDRLGRSLRELIETVDQLKGNGIGMMSLEGEAGYDISSRGADFSRVRSHSPFRTSANCRENTRWNCRGARQRPDTG